MRPLAPLVIQARLICHAINQNPHDRRLVAPPHRRRNATPPAIRTPTAHFPCRAAHISWIRRSLVLLVVFILPGPSPRLFPVYPGELWLYVSTMYRSSCKIGRGRGGECGRMWANVGAKERCISGVPPACAPPPRSALCANADLARSRLLCGMRRNGRDVPRVPRDVVGRLRRASEEVLRSREAARRERRGWVGARRARAGADGGRRRKATRRRREGGRGRPAGGRGSGTVPVWNRRQIPSCRAVLSSAARSR